MSVCKCTGPIVTAITASMAMAQPTTSSKRARSPRYPDHSKLMVWRDASGKGHPVRTPADWAKRRAHILAGMQEVMGPLPPASRKVPAILCPHPTSEIGKGRPAGLGGPYSRHYAVHLAERGYVTLAPDYVRFAEYKWDPYAHGYISASIKGVWDHMRAVDLLVSLPQVDPERIATIGHSLGGHNSMFVAVFDKRIKVIVSSCGFNAFRWYYGGDLTGWSHKGYMPKIPSYGGWRNMPFDFHEVVAALAPRPFFVNAPLKDSNFDVRGVTEAVEAARPVYRLLGAADRLKVIHPDCGHDFPDEVREQVYTWLDRELGHSKR